MNRLPVPELGTTTVPATPASPDLKMPAGAENIRFVLEGIQLNGITAYPSEEFKPLYKDLEGKKVSLSDIYQVAAAITQRYRHDGYVLSRAIIPAQQIKNGIITITVVEGSVGEVHTQGHYSATNVTQGIISRIQSMHPLNARVLEREVLLLNDLGGVNVRAVLEPVSTGDAAPGTVAIRLVFEEKPGSYSATIDNYGSRYLGPVEGTVNLSKGNLLLPYDLLTIAGIGSLPFSELRYISGQYIMPLAAEGLSLALSGGHGTADPAYRLESFNIHNVSTDAGASLFWKPIRQREENLTFGGGFAVKNVRSNILGSPFYDDNIRELKASAVYNRSDSWHGNNMLDTEIVQGLDLLGASHPGSPNISRAEGKTEFTKLDITANRLQDLTHSFQGYIAFHGQVTNNPLLSSEEFGYGGQSFGRAYDPSEIIGDDGIAGSVELRYNGIPAAIGIVTQPFVFYDVGKVWNIDTAGGSMSGASAGVGLRFATDYHVSGTFTAAQPLTRDVTANSPRTGHNPRLFFSITGQF
ncbi:MAG TPA: ShlB/FhaC/HecB family hemolysin secretion/activation protein [Rickettsiales bacterium]|nr:ShlB/FhaC/HecB family hemolysin secretion/activation protein [Rickettsiales bacterium]